MTLQGSFVMTGSICILTTSESILILTQSNQMRKYVALTIDLFTWGWKVWL